MVTAVMQRKCQIGKWLHILIVLRGGAMGNAGEPSIFQSRSGVALRPVSTCCGGASPVRQRRQGIPAAASAARRPSFLTGRSELDVTCQIFPALSASTERRTRMASHSSRFPRRTSAFASRQPVTPRVRRCGGPCASSTTRTGGRPIFSFSSSARSSPFPCCRTP